MFRFCWNAEISVQRSLHSVGLSITTGYHFQQFHTLDTLDQTQWNWGASFLVFIQTIRIRIFFVFIHVSQKQNYCHYLNGIFTTIQ
jgi:uncharacterized membrane protein